ncbi:Metallo-dependent phosphatase [Rhizodiscina lignyota]|uniref:Metallo-dependent phosphatase n=1 Tax=Rhizodiscina lignyota TaxID=1504668 RepID=A0A9P4IET3_9PEZI|nr:Metallo-dependent phosphatase [Rhizodiscina lignyota]
MFFSSKPRNIFDPPTPFERIVSSPLTFLVTSIYELFQSLRPAPSPHSPPIRVVCISDTHTLTYDIPNGDLLIHAGDLANAGTTSEIQNQLDWLSSLPHPQKVAIAGNHDTYLDPRSRMTLDEKDRTDILDWHGIIYLQHSSITLNFPERQNRQLKIYGAPQIPKCGGSQFAFQYNRGQDAWSDTVPPNLDILITHTPPKYHCDLAAALGCEWLLKEVWRVKPKLHVCGHIHAGAGREVLWWDQSQGAYESLRARSKKGLLLSMIDPEFWLEAAALLLLGLRGIVWTRIWGGEQRSTTLVNAALMYNNTGKLGNQVQVVLI